MFSKKENKEPEIMNLIQKIENDLQNLDFMETNSSNNQNLKDMPLLNEHNLPNEPSFPVDTSIQVPQKPKQLTSQDLSISPLISPLNGLNSLDNPNLNEVMAPDTGLVQKLPNAQLFQENLTNEKAINSAPNKVLNEGKNELEELNKEKILNTEPKQVDLLNKTANSENNEDDSSINSNDELFEKIKNLNVNLSRINSKLKYLDSNKKTKKTKRRK